MLNGKKINVDKDLIQQQLFPNGIYTKPHRNE